MLYITATHVIVDIQFIISVDIVAHTMSVKVSNMLRQSTVQLSHGVTSLFPTMDCDFQNEDQDGNSCQCFNVTLEISDNNIIVSPDSRQYRGDMSKLPCNYVSTTHTQRISCTNELL